MSKKPVSFHDAPPSQESTSRYKKAISDAKKVAQKPESKSMPRFDQMGASWQEKQPQHAREFLSETTKSQLKTLAELNQTAPPKENSVSEDQEVQGQEEEPAVAEEVELSEEDKLKQAIESRITPLDIGQYIMNGVATQAVPVIPDKLVVVFRTITDAEEVYVDKVLSLEKDITSRQFIRRNNEYALATHIHSVNGNKWPPHLNSDDEVDLDVMEVRLRHVRKLSSPIFNLLTDNLNWFLQRVHKELTFEVLGNG